MGSDMEVQDHYTREYQQLQAQQSTPHYRLFFIELLAVILIVVLLMLLALHAYRGQIDKAFTSGIYSHLVDDIKWITHEWQITGRMPQRFPGPLDASQRPDWALSYSPGTLTYVAQNAQRPNLHGRRLSFIAALSGPASHPRLRWLCNGAQARPDERLLGDNHTDLPTQYLMSHCRP